MHKAFKNSNLSEIFTKMYDSYLTQRTKIKNKDESTNSNNLDKINSNTINIQH